MHSACPPGQYSATSTVECTSCSTAASCASGSTSITDCSCNPGYWSRDTPPSATAGCTLCEPGSATNTLAGTGATTCLACKPGRFSPKSTIGCTTCRTCSNGKYRFGSCPQVQTSDSTKCLSCPANSTTDPVVTPDPASNASIHFCKCAAGMTLISTCTGDGQCTGSCNACPAHSTTDSGVEGREGCKCMPGRYMDAQCTDTPNWTNKQEQTCAQIAQRGDCVDGNPVSGRNVGEADAHCCACGKDKPMCASLQPYTSASVRCQPRNIRVPQGLSLLHLVTTALS